MRFAIVGGVAMAAHRGRIQTPRDLDIVASHSSENHRRLAEALAAITALWFPDTEVEWRAVRRGEAVVLANRYFSIHILGPTLPAPGIALSGPLREALVGDVDWMVVDRTLAPIASAKSLIRMKAGSERPQDWADVLQLESVRRHPSRTRRRNSNIVSAETGRRS
ncbi:MAG TPA: hypothetical protein VF529_17900 [Solirubrobacteraceae bacterium]